MSHSKESEDEKGSSSLQGRRRRRGLSTVIVMVVVGGLMIDPHVLPSASPMVARAATGGPAILPSALVIQQADLPTTFQHDPRQYLAHRAG
jgi:hypothetical protein